MPRSDLLALTPDDLAAITNRGTVKRAERELEAGSPTYAIDEPEDGDLVVTWSDGIVCRFPAGKAVHDAVCSSGIAGISRHVVRSVLAYQRHCAGQAAAAGAEETAPDEDGSGEGTAPPPAAPVLARSVWDPGTFTDDDLVARFRAAAVSKARRRFEEGVLVELVRGEKPIARFLDEPCTLRFMVPGDLRYVAADCAEPLLATYVPLAVWAFRALPAGSAAGLVALQQKDLPAPLDLLGELDALLAECATDGMAGCAASWPHRMTRLESALRETGLVWPAELAADLLHQQEMYAAHDARFDPVELVHLAGELIARGRAIASGTTAVPQLLIRGTRSDRVTEIAGGRLIGLGLGVRPGRRATVVSAYLQDADSGSVVAVERKFADPPEESGESPKSFADLAATVLTRGISLASLGSSQLLLKSGKRTPSGRLVLPRTAASMTANPQAFAWEQLKPPVALESFSQLAALREMMPPSCLRPRRLTDAVHVCAVAGVEEAAFDVAGQRLTAVLRDPEGGRAVLVHPYHARGRQGFDALAAALERQPEQVRFVCGHVAPGAGSLVLHPLCVVFDDGNRRTGLQPWIAPAPAQHASFSIDAAARGEAGDPLGSFFAEMRFELSELLLSGLRRSDSRTATAWSDLALQAQRVGFARLVKPLADLAGLLAQKAESPRWDAAPAARSVLGLCMYSRVLSDTPP